VETHLEDVVNLIKWEELSDVVLCGHSYGGCVITGVADRLPNRIGAMVYLDAFAPEDGESLLDVLPDRWRIQLLEATAREAQGWMVPPIPAAAFNVNAGDREWVDRQCTMHPIGTLRQAVELSGRSDALKSPRFILATDYDDSPFTRSTIGRERGAGGPSRCRAVTT
jgi:pimeloyl-ACP methyl ester carboxylesterase